MGIDTDHTSTLMLNLEAKIRDIDVEAVVEAVAGEIAGSLLELISQSKLEVTS